MIKGNHAKNERSGLTENLRRIRNTGCIGRQGVKAIHMFMTNV
jgi:hypothetical protein